MFVRFLLIMSITGLLFGCSSEKVKEDEPAAVEDLSTSAAASDSESTDAQAYGTDDSSTSGFSELDDPQSPLSIRVIYFDYDSSEIQAEYRSAVEAHAAYLIRNPNTSITLEGHADERGSREYNLALGERRSLSVREQMGLLGVSASQIRIVSYGEERPAVDGHDDYSWQQNRRVEILY